MKKLENFTNSLSILAEADFKLAEENDIYRTGIIGQFNLTFELAWKALQEIMRKHGVEDSSTGSPREILQLGYKFGFIDDSETWLLMLKKYNTSNIVIFDTNSMYYKLTNDYRSYKYLDLLNNGNFGRLGSINPIKEMRQLDKNTIYVFNPKLYNEYDKYSGSQLDVYTLEYFLKHYKKVDSILDFDIYMLKSEL